MRVCVCALLTPNLVSQSKLRAKFESEITKLLKEHLEFVENMKKEFGNLQEAHRLKMEQ